MSKTLKTKKDIRLKNGNVIPKGTEIVSWSPTNPDTGVVRHDLCVLATGNRVRVTNCGFKRPTTRTLEKWTEGGYANAPGSRERIEPDGFTSDGRPSWLLVEGLI